MTFRESILPATVKQAQKLDLVVWLHQQWRAGATAFEHGAELELAFELIFTLAPSKTVLVSIMAALTPDHWDRKRRLLAVPADQPLTYQRSFEATYEVVMPERLKGPIKRFMKDWPKLGGQPFRRPVKLTAQEYTEWLNERMRHLNQTLDRQLRGWYRALSANPPRMTLSMLCTTAPQLLVRRGMPGQLAMLFQSSPLPTTSPTPHLRDDARSQLGPGITRASVESRKTIHGAITIGDNTMLKPDPDLAERDTWMVDSVIRCVRQARETFINIAREQKAGENAFTDALNQAQARLVQIEAVEGSFAQLLLLWIAHMTQTSSGPKTSSIRTYSNRLLQPNLLAAPLTLSMADWDADHVVDAIELVWTDRTQWAPTTYNNFLETLAFFISFAHKLGYAEEAYVPGVAMASQASTRRQAVLGPGHIDRVIEQALIDAQSVDSEAETILYEQIAFVLILAFYGGMRAGEIRALTLAELIFESTERVHFDARVLNSLLSSTTASATQVAAEKDQYDDLRGYVAVLRGKTPAARRRLPLQAMMPDRWLQWLHSYVPRRTELSSHKRFDRIPALVEIREGASKLDPLKITMDYLRGFYGQQRDLHGLRHGAASLHFLRIAALRDPDLVGQLNDRDHPVFTDGSLRRLRHALETPQGEAIWERGLAEYWLTRVLGHSQLHTTMTTYVHTGAVVHGRWLATCRL